MIKDDGKVSDLAMLVVPGGLCAVKADPNDKDGWIGIYYKISLQGGHYSVSLLGGIPLTDQFLKELLTPFGYNLIRSCRDDKHYEGPMYLLQATLFKQFLVGLQCTHIRPRSQGKNIDVKSNKGQLTILDGEEFIKKAEFQVFPDGLVAELELMRQRGELEFFKINAGAKKPRKGMVFAKPFTTIINRATPEKYNSVSMAALEGCQYLQDIKLEALKDALLQLNPADRHYMHKFCEAMLNAGGLIRLSKKLVNVKTFDPFNPFDFEKLQQVSVVPELVLGKWFRARY